MAKRENGTGSIVKRKLANGTKYYAYTPCTYSKTADGVVTTKRILIGCFGKKIRGEGSAGRVDKAPDREDQLYAGGCVQRLVSRCVRCDLSADENQLRNLLEENRSVWKPTHHQKTDQRDHNRRASRDLEILL